MSLMSNRTSLFSPKAVLDGDDVRLQTEMWETIKRCSPPAYEALVRHEETRGGRR